MAEQASLKTKNRPSDDHHLPESVNPATALLKAQWELAQKELERENRERKKEADRAAARIAAEAEAIRIANGGRLPRSRSWNKQLMLQIFGGVAATLAIAGIVFFAATHWKHLQSIAITEFPQETMPTRTPTASNTIRPGQTSVGTSAASTAPTSDFTQGVSRLSEAFSRFPGVEPEDVMRTVNQKAANGTTPCPFDWKDGVPALQFGEKDDSVAGSLSRCSAAVEKLPAPRPAAP